ncbi:MAG: tRNA threonylcarbamoyladenosine dehydratase [Bacteroides sp.]|nr:tRNA threonylcarbamoyladenosine dehydratase [Prevotella sp.]MCM1408103.1 tRNA threonylcarbamoyladenosine dehydratase [Treponema brennaborense]MCM1469079.1 tRNA threonylcarbamoyladenosine dehydratase [Bacteroides sp.]
MDSERFLRTKMLLGAEKMERLARARIAIFGIGGVGGYAAEALARSGIGAFDLIDNDVVSVTNINRQIIALSSTIGQLKVHAAEQRIHEINPEATVAAYPVFYLPQTANTFDFSEYDYVIDAVDTVSAKIDIVIQAKKSGVPVISSMGAGNKFYPSSFEIADIYDTSVCPLARVMRREMRKRGITELKVVYSKEQPLVPKCAFDISVLPSDECEKFPNASKNSFRKNTPASIVFAPAAAGLLIASAVIDDLLLPCAAK